MPSPYLKISDTYYLRKKYRRLKSQILCCYRRQGTLYVGRFRLKSLCNIYLTPKKHFQKNWVVVNVPSDLKSWILYVIICVGFIIPVLGTKSVFLWPFFLKFPLLPVSNLYDTLQGILTKNVKYIKQFKIKKQTV